MKKAIFLDRDGTINIDYGYVGRPDDLHLLKNAGHSLKKLQDKGYLLIIITNQSGIGRKYYTLENFLSVNKILFKKLSRYGVRIDGVYFCPHDPDMKCSCRKPSSFMVHQAAEQWNIDLQRSFFIGDKTSDILCGKNAGCKTIMIADGPLKAKQKPQSIIEQADYTVSDLKKCLPIIERIELLQKKPFATAVIPARLKSSRIPHKLLQAASRTPLIKYTYKNLVNMGIFKDVIVATDSPRIQRTCRTFGATAVLTSKKHLSGTSRICEITKKIPSSVILNLQGDEPFISISHLDRLLMHFIHDKETLVASVMTRIRSKKELKSPSTVKVVTGTDGFALYFSRHPIPFERDCSKDPVKFKHLGLYAYKKAFFRKYRTFQPSNLELSEKLEQLTFLANGIKMKMIEAENDSLGIDIPEEIDLFRKTVSSYPDYFKNLLK